MSISEKLVQTIIIRACVDFFKQHLRVFTNPNESCSQEETKIFC